MVFDVVKFLGVVMGLDARSRSGRRLCGQDDGRDRETFLTNGRSGKESAGFLD